ncbi:error-prone DNA polymerase [Paraglaciecola aquimarina]|uniref:Error-prone DNA polymerase n=1 Tax=Paraglaciecola algarum TaxID=3050085 RepID=A0ABS9D0S3_9ALTE|nr:error-prone DNA polymerase [Paraglaciecola sp. G1-23]MCF2946533.1 error-prone DNA polymerase [Paraglaciecola sp. G1-23]
MSSTHYAELFCQSNFSFLHGASHPQELVKQADFLGYQAIAITDECSVAGVARAHTAIKEQNLNIKLIVGSLFCFEQSLDLVLLCPNRQAYAELCRTITNARKRANKGEYQLNLWDLRGIKHCLVIWLPKGQTDPDKHWGPWLKKHYNERVWIGYQRHLIANEHRYLKHLQQLSTEHQITISACGGVLMHISQRQSLQHTLTAIQKGKPIHLLGRELTSNNERYLRPIHKLTRLFEAQWLTESVKIAKQCDFDLASLRYEYPQELVPKGKTATAYLRELVLQGMQIRFSEGGRLTFAIKRIIVKELRLISELNYEYFFLTIYDIVLFAQKQQILYQGRGSAANSIVCYCLQITAVDPRQISVLFERFISRERQEEPDIDVDFEHERREEIIQYIYQKYGRERTAIAATVITYRHKSAIHEVGKALGVSEHQMDFFIKNMNHRDKGLGWRGQIAELGFAPESKQGQLFVELVDEIKGFPRHLSQHVGGFVISQGPLYHLVPIENAAMQDRTVIQWDKNDLESLGLLKVDVLALGMLTAIRKSFSLIQKYYQHQYSVAHITSLGDDAQVYKMIQAADTVGVFQIESRAQMSMLPRLKPTTFYDLVIQIAIVRPGPIQGGMVHPFLKHRADPNLITYHSQALKDVLSRTSGVPIFQEQVIKIAMVAAGFSGGEADQLRRAMGSWKRTGELVHFKDKLISGMLKRGYPEGYAQRIYQQICGFGEYGFPESHSASFAVLAYVSSWLKYYYPAAFYVGLLNSLPMGFYSASQLIQDAKRHNISVLPICINASDYQHKMEYQHETEPQPKTESHDKKKPRDKDWAIRLGIRLVKGVNKSEVENLLQLRPVNGFKDINQVKKQTRSKPLLEALASADVFHTISQNRYASRWQLMDTENELDLFKHQPSENSTNIPTPSKIDTLVEDYQATSLSLFTHPIALLRKENLLPPHTQANQLLSKSHQSTISVVGLVTGRQRPGTSKGVTFVTLEDDTGNINVVVWLATSRAQKQAYLKASILQVKGILERGDGDVTHVIAGKLVDLSHLLSELNTQSRNFH